MSIDLNDPKLTAYILGELPDAERTTVEQALAADPTLRAESDALRDMATRLQTELAAEAMPTQPQPALLPLRNEKTAARRFAIAASLLAAVGLTSYLAPRADWSDGSLTVAKDSSTKTRTGQIRPEDDAQYFSASPELTLPPKPTNTASSQRYDSPEQPKPGDTKATAEATVASQPPADTTSGLHLRVGDKASVQDPSRQPTSIDRLQGSIREGLEGQPASAAIAALPAPTSIASPVDAVPHRGGKHGEGEQAGQAARESAVDQAQGQYHKLTDQSSSSKGTPLATITGQTRHGESEVSKESSRVPFGERLPPLAPPYGPGTESYAPIAEQPFTAIRDRESALSTFSIDVDTASYSIVRRDIENRLLPGADAVRVEELINYFKYDYPQPEGDVPFSVNLEVAACPWQPEHRLVRVGLKGREIPRDKRPASNLVFLLDVSGSMQPENRLPLVKQSMKLLVEQLTENDRVAIVTYAGEAGLKLSSTTAAEKEKINAAIDSLYAGGSTNGEGGLRLAYDVAVANKIAGGTNRVILATDGDFNVGLSSDADMEALITEKAATGVSLTAIGVGMGNLQDSKLERLADKGNGNYAFVDKPSEAHKVFVEQLAGTLCTIAKDVKIQVEFNPATVRAHRLVGYENRLLAHKDFNDDRKDAGEIGAGHTVTALYEIVPASGAQVVAASGVDRSRYQPEPPAVPLTGEAKSGELMVVKLRYKQPEGTEGKLIETTVKNSDKRFYEASADFKFAAAVATFAMRLRDSQHRGGATFALALELAQSSLARDESGRRREFVDLVTRAKQLAGER